jgi:hypothetical protein
MCVYVTVHNSHGVPYDGKALPFKPRVNEPMFSTGTTNGSIKESLSLE